MHGPRRTHVMVERHGKAPLDSGESTRATSDDVNKRDLGVNVARLRTPKVGLFGTTCGVESPSSFNIRGVSTCGIRASARARQCRHG